MALRYFVSGVVTNNFGDTANWSLTSGGAGGQTVPTSADDVFFDANSPNCTMNATAQIKSLNFTGYTNTITMSNPIRVFGSITFKAGLLVAGTGALSIEATGTITTNGFTWANAFTFAGTSQTYTFADPFNISGLTTFSYVSTMTLNGSSTNKLIMAGGLTVTSTTVMTAGTADLNITGGTWQHTAAGTLINNLFLNGNVIIGANVYYRTGTLTYIAGSINATTNNSTININGSGTTTLINFHKINFKNVLISPSQTLVMNEFFSGSALMPTNISSTSTSTYTITFQDNFEKIAKFVNINYCTLSRPMQLLVITNSKKSSTNTRGIRYINQSPNGIAKNESSTLVQNTYGSQMLLNDPAMR